MSLTGTAIARATDLGRVQRLVADDLRAVDALIRRQLASNVDLINSIAEHIVGGGGKRLRPSLVLLSAKAFDYRGDHHLNLAAIIEFIHTATLLHDDVVDGSELRRGLKTANALWGDQASVLVGDFLYSRSFQMMVEIGSMRVMDILAETTNVISEGEVMQLLNCHDPGTTESRYLEVIHCKTAKLFEAAGQLGAVIAGSAPVHQQAMASFGLHVGTAYQLVDDVLDFAGSAQEIGKNVGDDLAEGKPTLPLIRAIARCAPAQAALIRTAIERGGRDHIARVIDAVESTDAIPYTFMLARAEADAALEALDKVPSSPFRQALEAFAEFAVSRRY